MMGVFIWTVMFLFVGVFIGYAISGQLEMRKNKTKNEAFANADELNESLQIAIQAVEKQMPKKPTPIDYKKYIGVIDNAELLRGAYWCPDCKHIVKSGCFCRNCGQKLDWSDENND